MGRPRGSYHLPQALSTSIRRERITRDSIMRDGITERLTVQAPIRIMAKR